MDYVNQGLGGGRMPGLVPAMSAWNPRGKPRALSSARDATKAASGPPLGTLARRDGPAPTKHQSMAAAPQRDQQAPAQARRLDSVEFDLRVRQRLSRWPTWCRDLDLRQRRAPSSAALRPRRSSVTADSRLSGAVARVDALSLAARPQARRVRGVTRRARQPNVLGSQPARTKVRSQS